MAHNKIGLAYYNVDTDRYQDIKIKKLKKAFSGNGIAIYDYILCEIYRVKGCFILWDDSTAFDVADYFGLKETLVNEIVSYCGTVGLFDKALLTGGNVITSTSIQARYKEMCKRAKRNEVIIPDCARIIEHSSVTMSDNEGSLPQSKVKYSKEEESKGEERRVPPEEFGSNIFFDLPVLEEKLKEDFKWLELSARRLNLMPDQVLKILPEFFLKLVTDGEEQKTLFDAKKHFNSWYEKNKKNGSNTHKEERIGNTSKSSLDALING